MTDTQQNWWYVFDEQTRILVVDDDPILLEFASVYLTTPMSAVTRGAGREGHVRFGHTGYPPPAPMRSSLPAKSSRVCDGFVPRA